MDCCISGHLHSHGALEFFLPTGQCLVCSGCLSVGGSFLFCLFRLFSAEKDRKSGTGTNRMESSGSFGSIAGDDLPFLVGSLDNLQYRVGNFLLLSRGSMESLFLSRYLPVALVGRGLHDFFRWKKIPILFDLLLPRFSVAAVGPFGRVFPERCVF